MKLPVVCSKLTKLDLVMRKIYKSYLNLPPAIYEFVEFEDTVIITIACGTNSVRISSGTYVIECKEGILDKYRICIELNGKTEEQVCSINSKGLSNTLKKALNTIQADFRKYTR